MAVGVDHYRERARVCATGTGRYGVSAKKIAQAKGVLKPAPGALRRFRALTDRPGVLMPGLADGTLAIQSPNAGPAGATNAAGHSNSSNSLLPRCIREWHPGVAVKHFRGGWLSRSFDAAECAKNSSWSVALLSPLSC